MSRPATTAQVRDTVRIGDLEYDRAPVTNGRYEEFVRATGHRAPAYWDDDSSPASLVDHPVVGIDYFDAVAFARWAGGCLPTELEWALGSGLEVQRAYPWGDGFDVRRCNTVRSERKGTSPVGEYEAAPSGLVDLCGNVWEMTCNADKEHEGAIIVKGGSWYDFPAHAKLDHNFRAPIHRVGRTVGFRLVYGRDERHPDFLEEELLEACIEFRRTDDDKGESFVAEEFDFGALRAELMVAHGSQLRAITEPTIEVENVQDALGWFDQAEAWTPEPVEVPEEKGEAQPRWLVLSIRMQTYLAERPPLMFGSAATAFLLVVIVLWSSISGGQGTRTVARFDQQPSQPVSIRRLASTSAPQLRRHRVAAEKTVAALVGADEGKREIAARVLLARGERSRAELQEAWGLAKDADTKARIEYLIQALDERKTGPGSPVAISVPPARGLVLLCDRFGSAEQKCLGVLRRWGRVIGHDVTLVFTGSAHVQKLLQTHEKALGSVLVVPDRSRNFARANGLKTGTAVIGLRSDGRQAFVLPGTPSESRIADQIRALR
ncbi:MAG: SUMF1/EgtB/PvdO family nonheme iron enzyme [Planctomycetota bacterium]